jgi:hypothetical protein
MFIEITSHMLLQRQQRIKIICNSTDNSMKIPMKCLMNSDSALCTQWAGEVTTRVTTNGCYEEAWITPHDLSFYDGSSSTREYKLFKKQT